MLRGVFSAEVLKLRRTFLLQSLWLVPLIAVALPLPIVLTKSPSAHDQVSWATWTLWPMTLWSAFLAYFYAGVVSSLIYAPEHRQSTWKMLYAQPTPRWMLVLGKNLALMATLIVAHAALFLFILGAMGVIHLTHGGPAFNPVPWRALGATLGGACISTLPAAFLCALVSARTSNIAAPMGLTILGLCGGMLISDTSLAPYYPWTMGSVWLRNLITSFPQVRSAAQGFSLLYSAFAVVLISGGAVVLSCVSEQNRDIV